MNIFLKKDLKESSFLQKTFGKQPAENSIVELNNLLAYADNIAQVTTDQVTEIETKYKTDFNKKFLQERLDLYKLYLQFCLIDNKLDTNDVNSLKHITTLLRLKDTDVNRVC